MDIQELVKTSKESLLSDDSFLPALLLELEKETILFSLEMLSDQQSILEQVALLAGIAYDVCKKHPDQKPLGIGFWSTAWHISNPETREEALMPVHSERKREVLVVAVWQAEKEDQSISFPIIRAEDRIIAFGPPEEVGMLPSQVVAFRHGALDAQKPDEEVFQNLNNRIEQRLKRLSPEMSAELRQFLRRQPRKDQ